MKMIIAIMFGTLVQHRTKLFCWSAAFCVIFTSNGLSASPPQIRPTASLLQSQAVDVGQNITFSVSASGDAPLSYQWRLDGSNLIGRTNRIVTITAAQASDEGDYTVVVSNAFGVAISDPARLWVVPLAHDFVKSNFTNSVGQRLPYFYLVPKNYCATRKYPLFCWLHWGLYDELTISDSAAVPVFKVFASTKQQETDPTIILWPTRRIGDTSWTPAYINLVADFLDHFVTQFNVDTNRIYLEGASAGVHAAWDVAGMKPDFFAGVRLLAGSQGSASASLVKTLPIWVFQSASDFVGDSRPLVRSLRLAGGNPIYTEYAYPDHQISILGAEATPAAMEWLLAQRKGLPSAHEPLLLITNQIRGALRTTGATNLNLAGSANALGQNVTNVTWENLTASAKGAAAGSNAWSATDIPLLADTTNLLTVTATTTSWSPLFGGHTTFNDAFTIVSSPIRARLVLQEVGVLMDWNGGAPPYSIQRASDLSQSDWTELLSNAVSPVTIPMQSKTEFFRVVGR